MGNCICLKWYYWTIYGRNKQNTIYELNITLEEIDSYTWQNLKGAIYPLQGWVRIINHFNWKKNSISLLKITLNNHWLLNWFPRSSCPITSLQFVWGSYKQFTLKQNFSQIQRALLLEQTISFRSQYIQNKINICYILQYKIYQKLLQQWIY